MQKQTPNTINNLENSEINGKTMFLRVAIISIINTLFIYLNINFVLYFSLDITKLIDYTGINELDIKTKIIYIGVSLLVSALFIMINYFANKVYKVFYKIGFVLYVLDSFISLYFFDIFGILTHALILKLVYDFLKEQKN